MSNITEKLWKKYWGNNIDIEEVDKVTIPVSTEPPSDTIKRLEEEYGATLDEKCRDIQNRDFSSLLDQKSRDLYKMRKMNETGEKATAEEEAHSGVLKYTPQKKDAVYTKMFLL